MDVGFASFPIGRENHIGSHVPSISFVSILVEFIASVNYDRIFEESEGTINVSEKVYLCE